MLSLIRKYANQVAPDTAFVEALEWPPEVSGATSHAGRSRPRSTRPGRRFGAEVECEVCSQYEAVARQRIEQRDEDDWPVLAAALTFDCPIWTEDTDFFGCGVATWTTDRGELYLAKIGPRQQL